MPERQVRAGWYRPRSKAYWGMLLTSGLFLAGCLLNNPYPPGDALSNTYYSSFGESPKHLDPVRSYSSNEYVYLGIVYEPPFQYHYLKRPYELVPLTATAVPEPIYLDDKGIPLAKTADRSAAKKIVYRIRIKPGIRFQKHPCFSRDAAGNYRYHHLTEEDLIDVNSPTDLAVTGEDTRELVANDYVYQMKRMAHPSLECPIFQTMAQVVEGMSAFAKELSQDLKEIRQKRAEEAGAGYNREKDEQDNPIDLKLDERDLAGVRVVDRYTYEVTLTRPYPQLLLWMTLPFFAPMPPEAEGFYRQPLLRQRNIDLQHWPVGTGPYRFEEYASNQRIVLLKNEHFNHETYPTAGAPGDRAAGLLADAGKPLPLIDRIIFTCEKEDIPRWVKFLQGYYDASGIPKSSFDKSISFDKGQADITAELKDKDIQFSTAVDPTIFYNGFNMLDPVVGGYTEKKRKLRQAISIIWNSEDFIQIFRNGRGVPAMSPLAPGIFGYRSPTTPEGINPQIYNWDVKKNRAVRKSVEEAKQLLAEAGYPGGIGEDGPLVLYYDTMSVGPDAMSYLTWLRKQFRKIDVQLQIRATDYRQFQEKMDNGAAQLFSWGWHADYPDPENFLFLLYGPNRKARGKDGKGGGENAANYESEEFDRLFRELETMVNGPERQKVIDKAVAVVRQDAPWVFHFHPVSFGLRHSWLRNSKPMTIGSTKLKYIRIDAGERAGRREEWNQPQWQWPAAILGLLLVGSLPAILSARRRAQTL